jgi:hypothetical protein
LLKENERIKMRFKGFFTQTKKPELDVNLVPDASPRKIIEGLPKLDAPIAPPVEFTNTQTFLKSDEDKGFYKSSESIDSLQQRRITVKTTIKCFLTERKPQQNTESDEYTRVERIDNPKQADDDTESLYKIVDPIPLPRAERKLAASPPELLS